MTFFAVAAVTAGATLLGSAINSRAVGKAADSQAKGTADGIAENRRQFDISQTNQAPYLAAGKQALGTLASENDTPLDLSKIQMDPGYEFARSQGQQAIDRQGAAAGGRISGAALKRASQYNTDFATTGYSAAYQRANQTRTDRLSRLAALAGVGQTATQNIGALGADTASRNSALISDGASNRGAAQVAQGNIWGNAGNQIAALYGRNSTPPPPSVGSQYVPDDSYYASGSY